MRFGRIVGNRALSGVYGGRMILGVVLLLAGLAAAAAVVVAAIVVGARVEREAEDRERRKRS